jgi:hypothetical protein
MGWLRRLLGATPKEEMDGIRLDTNQPFWELSGKTDFPSVLRALASLLPEGSILYLEDGSPNNELRRFLEACAIPEQSHVAIGTIWPKPAYHHVPATPQNLTELARLSEHCAAPELAVHFHAYHEGKIVLEWHDALDQPMLLSGIIPDNKVKTFAQTLSLETAKGRT